MKIQQVQLFVLETGIIGGIQITYKDTKKNDYKMHRKMLQDKALMEESTITLQEGEDLIGFISGGSPICRCVIEATSHSTPIGEDI